LLDATVDDELAFSLLFFVGGGPFRQPRPGGLRHGQSEVLNKWPRSSSVGRGPRFWARTGLGAVERRQVVDAAVPHAFCQMAFPLIPLARCPPHARRAVCSGYAEW